MSDKLKPCPLGTCAEQEELETRLTALLDAVREARDEIKRRMDLLGEGGYGLNYLEQGEESAYDYSDMALTRIIDDAEKEAELQDTENKGKIMASEEHIATVKKAVMDKYSRMRIECGGYVYTSSTELPSLQARALVEYIAELEDRMEEMMQCRKK